VTPGVGPAMLAGVRVRALADGKKSNSPGGAVDQFAV
jgi:hypothetical protein